MSLVIFLHSLPELGAGGQFQANTNLLQGQSLVKHEKDVVRLQADVVTFCTQQQALEGKIQTI